MDNFQESSVTSTTTTTTISPIILTESPSRKRHFDYCKMEADSEKECFDLRYKKPRLSTCLTEVQTQQVEKMLHDFGFEPVRMEKPWEELNLRAQQQHAKMFSTFIKALADLKSGSKNSAIGLIKKSVMGFDFLSLSRSDCDEKEETIKTIKNFYLKADNKMESYQYLSILASAYPYRMVEKYIPNIHPHEYQEARKLGLRKLADQKPIEKHRQTSLRKVSMEAISDFVAFLGR